MQKPVVTEVGIKLSFGIFTKSYRLTRYDILCWIDHFVRSGYVDVGQSYLKYTGPSTIYWSRVGATANVAYYLDVSDSTVVLSRDPNNRRYGFSLRCLQEYGRMIEVVLY